VKQELQRNLIPFMTGVFRGENISCFNMLLKSCKGCDKTQQKMKRRFRDRVTICNLVSLSQNCNIMARCIDVLDLQLE